MHNYQRGVSNGDISGWIKSKTASGGHFEKVRTVMSETHDSIHFMYRTLYVHRPYFARGLYNHC